MDVKNNGKFDLFKGLPRYNTILNWFADMSEDVEREILSLQSKLTPKMIEKCQKGKRFEIESSKIGASFSIYKEDNEMELDVDSEKDNQDCLLNICSFSEDDLEEMLENDENNLEVGSFNFQMDYEIASLEVSDYDKDIQREYSLKLQKSNGELYLLLTKSDVVENTIYPDYDNIIKKHISNEELEEYFGLNIKKL